jgi:hypothetical protein
MTKTVTKIIYELYNSDFSNIKDSLDADTHEIDREIYIALDDGERIYISWANTPIEYSIDYKESSWFENESEKVLDASSWKIWKPIIGKSFELIFHDKNKQLLELKSKNASIYFSPLEICGSSDGPSWSTDVLHISSNKPRLID